MSKLLDKLEKLEYVFNKIVIIIKKYILPIPIAITILIILIKFLGYDAYYSKIAKVLDIESEFELVVLLILLIFMWILYDYIAKSSLKYPRNEYREYLLKELDDRTENSDINHSKENETANNAEEIKTCFDNVIIEQSKTNKKDIIALMLKNNDEITEYFKISKSQAKSSFWVSVISCIAGMGALAVGIYGIVLLKDVSVSVISLISGSISELISGTVFWVHNKSALQLNHYYDALHENEKFLSAVNIADKLSAEKRENILVEIIHKQINNETPKIEPENIKEKNNQVKKDY